MYRLFDNYVLVEKLGSGSFGEVYLGVSVKNNKLGKYVAIKVENNDKVNRMVTEYKTYKQLNRLGFKKGIPKTYEFIETPEFRLMVMQLLGSNLEELFNKHNRLFEINLVKNIGIQIIKLIQNLHRCRFLHRDIKPNNFLIGRENDKQIYMMDFGLSKKYTTDDGRHIKMRDGRSLIGTARYASINMHNGIEPSRRDDLESIGYMLIYFAKGRLPWQGIKKIEGVSNITLIGEKKRSTTIKTLCQGLPPCFSKYIDFCRKLQFDEAPDYDYLSSLFL